MWRRHVVNCQGPWRQLLPPRKSEPELEEAAFMEPSRRELAPVGVRLVSRGRSSEVTSQFQFRHASLVLSQLPRNPPS